ncbi:hypothetical protein [Rhodopseudomonas palustris]|nr:hypothetical protein [Rhodopseudomonas palustris]
MSDWIITRTHWLFDLHHPVKMIARLAAVLLPIASVAMAVVVLR